MLNLDDLLAKTSRTFALAIPLLPEPTRFEVGLAYLLFRIADTFEDAAVWPREKRLDALEAFADLLEAPDARAAERLVAKWLEHPPTEHAGYLELLRATPEVMNALASLPADSRAIVAKHARRTAEGMAQVVTRSDAEGHLALASLRDLRDYCYIVAGIVGELLTELFLLHDTNAQACARVLHEKEIAFGEGLQLVNILKDAGDDARDGRSYLPTGVARTDVFALARRDLDAATTYVNALQKCGAERGIVAFTALPVMLARASLDRLAESGPGAKVSRADVARIVAEMNDALDRGVSPLA